MCSCVDVNYLTCFIYFVLLILLFRRSQWVISSFLRVIFLLFFFFFIFIWSWWCARVCTFYCCIFRVFIRFSLFFCIYDVLTSKFVELVKRVRLVGLRQRNEEWLGKLFEPLIESIPYSSLPNKRGGGRLLIFLYFSNPPEAYLDPRLLIFRKKWKTEQT